VGSYPLALNIISDCWILFAIIWLIAAIWTRRSIYKESRWQRLGYVIPILVGGYLAFKGQRLSDPLNLRVIPHVDALAWMGVVLCTAGLAFCIWARFTLGRNWSGVVTFKGGHELDYTRTIRAGAPSDLHRAPDHVRRNRDLLGHEAGIIAMPLVFVSIWIKLRREEKLMLQKFPDQYAAYQHRVKTPDTFHHLAFSYMYEKNNCNFEDFSCFPGFESLAVASHPLQLISFCSFRSEIR
jgi:protein-S-isoprenylcysteine O-methyltransferase Ste14